MKDGKSINFELNLLPVISVLAVCLSFLLLTAVWVHIGTLDVAQSIGSTGQSSADEPAIWIQFETPSTISLHVKNVDAGKPQVIRISSKDKGYLWQSLQQKIKAVKSEYQSIDTAFLLPHPQTSLEEMVQVIDYMKGLKVNNVGVSPIL